MEISFLLRLLVSLILTSRLCHLPTLPYTVPVLSALDMVLPDNLNPIIDHLGSILPQWQPTDQAGDSVGDGFQPDPPSSSLVAVFFRATTFRRSGAALSAAPELTFNIRQVILLGEPNRSLAKPLSIDWAELASSDDEVEGYLSEGVFFADY
jgi:hypothetical protein